MLLHIYMAQLDSLSLPSIANVAVRAILEHFLDITSNIIQSILLLIHKLLLFNYSIISYNMYDNYSLKYSQILSQSKEF